MQPAPSQLALSCFAGRLRRDRDGWRWSDGGREERIQDAATARLDLRCRERRAPMAQSLVEVPWSLAEAFDALAWVVRGFNACTYEVDISSGSYPAISAKKVTSTAQCPADRRVTPALGMTVALVPADEWRNWCAACPVTPWWSVIDEEDLRSRAAGLGWKP